MFLGTTGDAVWDGRVGDPGEELRELQLISASE